jgi:hypothetical protein
MTAAPAEKKKRSPLERMVVWGFILLLALVVGLEYRGMTGYNQTLTAWEEKLEDARISGAGFTLSEAKSMAKMSPTYAAATTEGSRVETVAKWFTVLSFMPDRKYEIHIELDKASEDAHVITLTTAATAAARELEDQLLDKAPVTLDPSTIPKQPGATRQPAAGGQPGGGGGGGQRSQRPGNSGGTAALGEGLDMGIIGKLLDPEVQKSLNLSEDQMDSIGGLKDEVVAGLEGLGSAGLRGPEKQPVLDGFIEKWTTKAQSIVGDKGIEALKKLADPSEK